MLPRVGSGPCVHRWISDDIPSHFIYRFDPFKKKAPQLLVADDDLYTDLTETENKDSDGDGVVDFLGPVFCHSTRSAG
jgi:hypothetical protein